MKSVADSGQAENAKRTFVQYTAWMSQWRYGVGGTMPMLRSSLMQLAFMFASWPSNYGDFLTFVGNPKNQLYRQAFSIAASVAASMMIVSAMGFPAYRWFAMGPVPDEWGLMGPAVDQINKIWRAIRASGQYGMTRFLPLSDQDNRQIELEQERAWKNLWK